MAALLSLAACSLAVAASGSQISQATVAHHRAAAAAGAGQRSAAPGFVRGLEFKHRLRVCNAYPYAAALDVYRGRGERLTGDQPMPYKDCRDFLSPLKAGDKLEFKVGDAQAGTFSVSDLPNNDAVLLLVIHRHDTLSTAVSFESHVFANLLNAQVAVIDTYKGRANASPRILDSEKGEKKVAARSEELRYNSVVAVNPGIYEVDLDAPDGSTKVKSDLVALNRESYVIMRVGVESESGPNYPQEMVIFPHSPADALPSTKSGAQARAFPLVALLFAAFAAALAALTA